MQSPCSLKQIFQSFAPEPMGVLRGRVVSAEPLVIQGEGDQKLRLGCRLLCLPDHLDDLRADDRVYLLSFNYGKKYIVLGREKK